MIAHNGISSRRKVVVDWECVNSQCEVVGSKSKNMINGGKEHVRTASNYVISFYGQEPKKNGLLKKQEKTSIFKKRKVCLSCLTKANNAQDKMLENLVRGDSIIKDKLFPTPKDVVLIEDSDEEPISDTSSESELELDLETLDDESIDNDCELERNLELRITNTLSKIKVDEQIKDTLDILSKRLNNLQPEYDATNDAIKKIEKEVDRIREEFYGPFRPVVSFLDPLDLNKAEMEETRNETLVRRKSSELVAVHASGNSTAPAISSIAPLHAAASLPSAGKLDRPDLQLNDKVYAVRGNILNVWKLANVVEVVPGTELKYKVRFETIRHGKCTSCVKTLCGKQLAYSYPASVRLQVGTRIIGIYNDNPKTDDASLPSPSSEGEYFSGIIAEPPKAMNKHRYLVFFDDGYASYISHKDIRAVCKQTIGDGTTSSVWDDIHQNSRDFIKKYILQYPERPMVRLVQGQIVRTEWEGSWWYTRVEEVDASLVKLIFHVNGRKESIYRGSTRLEPLYLEMQQQKKRAEQIILNRQAAAEGENAKVTPNVNRFMPRNRIEGFKKNRPYVEYTRQVEPDSPDQPDNQPVRRAVAKKSTASKRSPVHTSNEPLTDKPSWDKKVSK